MPTATKVYFPLCFCSCCFVCLHFYSSIRYFVHFIVFCSSKLGSSYTCDMNNSHHNSFQATEKSICRFKRLSILLLFLVLFLSVYGYFSGICLSFFRNGAISFSQYHAAAVGIVGKMIIFVVYLKIWWIALRFRCRHCHHYHFECDWKILWR